MATDACCTGEFGAGWLRQNMLPDMRGLRRVGCVYIGSGSLEQPGLLALGKGSGIRQRVSSVYLLGQRRET